MEPMKLFSKLNKERQSKCRHEYKFFVNEVDIALLQSRIEPLMEKDIHTGTSGIYQIRSVYFDDYWDTCYRQNEDGTDPRGKWRIRIYDGSDERISLEHKIKEKGMTRKESARITREWAEGFLQGIPLDMREASSQDAAALVQKFSGLMMVRRLLPRTIVEYERTPYVEKNGNVRVTIDRNIASGGCMEEFFERDIGKRPIMPAGRHVLEIKYDEYLPSYLKEQLELGNLRQTTFSKYYLCRRYEEKTIDTIRK